MLCGSHSRLLRCRWGPGLCWRRSCSISIVLLWLLLLSLLLPPLIPLLILLRGRILPIISIVLLTVTVPSSMLLSLHTTMTADCNDFELLSSSELLSCTSSTADTARHGDTAYLLLASSAVSCYCLRLSPWEGWIAAAWLSCVRLSRVIRCLLSWPGRV